MANDHFKQREWNAICDICGFKYKASDLMDSGYYPGLKVCKHDHDKIHPQDKVRSVEDTQRVAWTRPDPDPVFVDVSNDTQPDDL